MYRAVIDIEADGLLESVTKIHCLCYNILETGESKSLVSYGDIISFLSKGYVLIGHNLIRYDIPVLEKILGVKVDNSVIDTLGLSWYLYDGRLKHGLEEWGVEFGVPKPVVLDWTGLSIAEYVHRCSEDVKINTLLWNKQEELLKKLYGDFTFIVSYLNMILFYLKIQDAFGCYFDVERARKTLDEIKPKIDFHYEELKKVMPPVPVWTVKKKPVRMYNKNGDLTIIGEKWVNFLKEQRIFEEVEEVKYIKSYDNPNPGSTKQLKDWLYSLGWVPESFSYVRNKETNEVKKIEQINNEDKELCSSIKALFDVEPALSNLEGISLLEHRYGLIKGLIEEYERLGTGRIFQKVSSLANSQRLKHQIIANLPKPHKLYGNEIRGLFYAPEGYLLCGSDLSSIEDTTKRHYIYPYDPKYVQSQLTPGFDAHLDIAVLGGFLSEADVEWYKKNKKRIEKGDCTIEEKEKFEDISIKRGYGKTVNFAAVYKVGAPTLSRNSKLPIDKAKSILNTYWKRNWAVKKFEEDLLTKKVDDRLWVLNPLNGVWYSLRAEKDKFSVVNQSSAVFIFWTWVWELLKLGIRSFYFTIHDEVLFLIKEEEKEETEKLVLKAMENVNKAIKLRLEIKCSIAFGKRYNEVH